MRLDQFQRLTTAVSASAHGAKTLRGFSRRSFIAGSAVAAAVGGVGLLNARPARSASPGGGLIVPIPYGLDFVGDGSLFHVEAPPFPGAGEDPSTVFNFAGASAIAFIDGLVDRTDRKTGEVETLPFLASDMRFMQGRFRGRDGHVRAATFGFI